MANLLDYMRWRGDLTMACMPFNAVDGLILAWLANLNLEGIAPSSLGDAARRLKTQTLSESNAAFVAGLEENDRFSCMELLRFEQKFSEQEEMQFAAATFSTGDGRMLITFRGTDSTLTGWKENFNLSFSDEVPAQREAVRYLTEAAPSVSGPIRVAGHSKGGNLAVYAASHCPDAVREQVERVYNFDGPGQNAQTMASPGYRALENRIETYLPQCSLVGVLLEQAARYEVVQSSAEGVMQHDPFTWLVRRDGFELAAALSGRSLYADRTLDRWLRSMPPEQRRALVETLYSLAESTGAKTVGELATHWRELGWSMLDAFSEFDLPARLNMYSAVGKLLGAAVRSLGS